MTYNKNNLSDALEKELLNGYDISRISKTMFMVYQEHGLALTPELNEIILQLMAMDEGPEFEFSEKELWCIINELRKT